MEFEKLILYNTVNFSRTVKVVQMKDNGGLLTQNSRLNEDTGQAPRTADVLNAVLDMHSDRLGALGFLANNSSAASPLVWFHLHVR